MEEFKIISNIFSAPVWESILKTGLDIADEVGIVFPNGEYDEENPLLTGMPDFIYLPSLTASSWPNMEDATIYRGKLTASLSALISKYMNESEETSYSLWNFSLYKNQVELLNVSDFNVCLIDSGTELMNILECRNINWQDL